MDLGSLAIDKQQIETVRRIYVAQPWTTAAGLALRFGISVKAASAAVVGGWRGRGELRASAIATNLADERREKRARIEQRLAGRGRVKLEPHLEGLTWTAFDRDDEPAREPCQVCAARERRQMRRRQQVEINRRTYQPLVGASKRAMNQRIKEQRAAKLHDRGVADGA